MTTPLHEAVDLYLARCRRVDGCLLAPTVNGRYGEVWYDGRNRMSAHRAVYTVKVGPIPAGLVVRHRCDIKACAEIAHLEVGTAAQNVRDEYDRARRSNTWRKGDDHPCAVLTAAIVSDLRVRAAAGERLHDLAAEYGLTYLTMCSAIRGRTWAHVETPPAPGVPRRPNPRALAVSRRDECLTAAGLADDGLTLVEIGARMGVSRMTAFNLVKSGRALLFGGAA